MRNAYRYIFTTCIQHPKKKTSVLQRKKEEKRDLEILETYIEKRLTKANTAEYRMICRIKELYEELADYRDKNNITAFAQKLIRCIQKDFCEKYLEIIKLRTSDITNQVAVFCTGMLLKMVYPILPFASEKIWEMYNFKGNIS
jgi:valyl-tRNA synthetase